jgi:iron complex outermembrane receptor protein
VTAPILHDFTASLAGAWTHARYSRFPDAAGYIFDPVTGVTAVSVDASGGHEQRSPDYSGTASLDYHTPLFGGTLALDATGSYQSRVYFDSIEYATQKAYGTLNLRADWTDPSQHLTLSVFGQNVTDTKYISQVLPDSAFFGQTYGQPATVGGEVRYRW